MLVVVPVEVEGNSVYQLVVSENIGDFVSEVYLGTDLVVDGSGDHKLPSKCGLLDQELLSPWRILHGTSEIFDLLQ